MTNTLLTTSLILNEALLQLENALVLTKLCNRDYEQTYSQPMKHGSTIRIRRPIHGVVRTGPTMQIQDLTDATVALTVGTQIGADLDASSLDMTLSISDFGERYLAPQMLKIANAIDVAAHQELVLNCPNWVGTPGQTINSFQDYAQGPKRLDNLSVPQGKRAGILSPSDYWDTVGSVTGLFMPQRSVSALEESKLGRFAMTDTYMSQNIINMTVGTWGTTPLINGAGQVTTYLASKDTQVMTLNVKGLTATTGTVSAGDVFTIAGVFAVNVVTQATQSFLRQFVVKTAGTADGSGNIALTISPPIIISGSYQTCSAAPADGAAITIVGTPATSYPQNVVFHPDAITLAVPPLFKPPGAVICETRSYKGISLRLIQGFDMTNDLSQWRFDVLYGLKATQPELAVRLSGSP